MAPPRWGCRRRRRPRCRRPARRVPPRRRRRPSACRAQQAEWGRAPGGGGGVGKARAGIPARQRRAGFIHGHAHAGWCGGARNREQGGVVDLASGPRARRFAAHQHVARLVHRHAQRARHARHRRQGVPRVGFPPSSSSRPCARAFAGIGAEERVAARIDRHAEGVGGAGDPGERRARKFSSCATSRRRRRGWC